MKIGTKGSSRRWRWVWLVSVAQASTKTSIKWGYFFFLLFLRSFALGLCVVLLSSGAFRLKQLGANDVCDHRACFRVRFKPSLSFFNVCQSAAEDSRVSLGGYLEYYVYSIYLDMHTSRIHRQTISRGIVNSQQPAISQTPTVHFAFCGGGSKKTTHTSIPSIHWHGNREEKKETIICCLYAKRKLSLSSSSSSSRIRGLDAHLLPFRSFPIFTI